MAEEGLDHNELINQLRGVKRIVINRQFGGFSLSRQAALLYLELSGIPYTFEPQLDRDTQNRIGDRIVVNGKDFWDRDIPRDDPALVAVVHRLGSEAGGDYATLKIVEIPGDVDWFVDEYDGKEWVAEKHRTWR